MGTTAWAEGQAEGCQPPTGIWRPSTAPMARFWPQAIYKKVELVQSLTHRIMTLASAAPRSLLAAAALISLTSSMDAEFASICSLNQRIWSSQFNRPAS